MSAALHLARAEDLDKILPLVDAFHREDGLPDDPEALKAGVQPLLTGSPYGAIYAIGPRKAPIGYAAITFGWSIEFGGMDAFVDEIYLRPSIRGRGIGSEVLQSLSRTLAENGVKALHLEVDQQNEGAKRLYARAGFRTRERYALMTRMLS